MPIYNVPVLGNVSVEAESEKQAIAIVERAFREGAAAYMAIEIFSSLEVDNTGVSEL